MLIVCWFVRGFGKHVKFWPIKKLNNPYLRKKRTSGTYFITKSTLHLKRQKKLIDEALIRIYSVCPLAFKFLIRCSLDKTYFFSFKFYKENQSSSWDYYIFFKILSWLSVCLWVIKLLGSKLFNTISSAMVNTLSCYCKARLLAKWDQS